MHWLTKEEQKYQTALETKIAMSKKSERDLRSINQVFDGKEQQGINFILKNTLKDVLMNLDLPEINDGHSQNKVKAKKSDNTSKTAFAEGKYTSVSSVRSSKASRASNMSTISKPTEEATTEKVFFADANMNPTKLTGRTSTFISKDGVKITFNKNNDLKYDSLDVDVNQSHFVMHITRDEYFKFHFHLQNDVIINFVKPVNKSVVNRIKTDKLYTLLRNYSYRLNNFSRVVKKQETYLISDDVLERIRTKMRMKAQQRSPISRSKPSVTSTPTKVPQIKHVEVSKPPAHQKEQIGDVALKELQSKQDALDMLHHAKLSNQPAFKICSSKLHKFKYITRKKSHQMINFRDAALEIGNIRDPSTKHKYVIRELVGSIDNEDINSNMPYNYSVTYPSSLTVRSEVDIQGKKQIKQYYIQKGPQLKNIHSEVSRTFTYNGDMIIKKTDGTITILTLNGDIINFDAPLYDRKSESPSKKKVKTYDKYVRALRRLIKSYHKHTTERLCINSSRKRSKVNNYQYIPAKSLLIAKRFKFPHPKYSILLIDGKKISFKEGTFVQSREYFPVLYEDIIYATFKYTRQDGTTTELNRNGDMLITFPDKTTLISSYAIDKEPIFIDIECSPASDSEFILESGIVTGTPWVLIHSSREFRHPYYATVKFGGISDITDIALPCDISLQNIGDEFKLKINPNVEATIDTSKVVLNSNFCSYCEGGTSTTINIENLYDNEHEVWSDSSSDLVVFRDSFNRHLDIQSNGTISNNEHFEPDDLNMYKCRTHRTFNERKFYILKQDLSGIRLWPRDGYLNRLLQTQQNSENAPDVHTQRVDDIYFLVKYFVPLFNKFLMEPVLSEDYYETYRFLQKMPYNKHTNLLLRESEAVTLTNRSSRAAPLVLEQNQEPDRTPSELEAANVSSTTLFTAETPPFKSFIQIAHPEFTQERYERIQRICRKRREREAIERENMKKPINYFLYKEIQESEERDRKQMIEECPTNSNLKLTHKTLKLVPNNISVVSLVNTAKEDEEKSIRTIYSTTMDKSNNEIFAVKSYISSKKYPSLLNAPSVRTYSSATLIKQHSALNVAELSTLIHIHQLNPFNNKITVKDLRTPKK